MASNSKIWSELKNTEDIKKNFLKLKMEHLPKPKQILQIEQQRLDFNLQANEMDFPTFTQLQNE